MTRHSSAIAAVSTAFGKGGIAVIRISGADAAAVAERFFRAKNGTPLHTAQPNRMVYGDIIGEDGSVIDSCLAVFFQAPHSFTGENVVELHCHGGILLTRTVLELTFAHGAVPAQAGEFTRRAFLSGKLSLSQAEAVADLIDAKSMEGLKLAAAQSRGILSRRLRELYDLIMEAVTSIYAYVDFPDEDMTDYDQDELEARLHSISGNMTRLLATYRSGKAIGEGVRTVIVGKPNTGKSSLLNLLLGEERAIVASAAGTTRDTIEETAVLGRVTLRLCDTAGIHQTGDEIESLGIQRSLAKLEEADLILAVFDGSEPLDSADEALIQILHSHVENGADVPMIAVVNKSDLPPKSDAAILRQTFPHCAVLSAKDGSGLDALTETIERLYIDGAIHYDEDAIIANARQYGALHRAHQCLQNAICSLQSGMTQDIAGLDLELSLSALAELDGRQITEEVVDQIFHRFCVGK